MVGYSGTPLVKKLGIKPGFSLFIINPPEHYWDLVAPLPSDVNIVDEGSLDIDFIHYFEVHHRELSSRFLGLSKRMKKDGMLWISWPKKGSAIETDLTGQVIRDTLLKSHLVDIKVCAVDQNWSGLKFVIRSKFR